MDGWHIAVRQSNCCPLLFPFIERIAPVAAAVLLMHTVLVRLWWRRRLMVQPAAASAGTSLRGTGAGWTLVTRSVFRHTISNCTHINTLDLDLLKILTSFRRGKGSSFDSRFNKPCRFSFYVRLLWEA